MSCGLTALVAIADKPAPLARAALKHAAAERGTALPENFDTTQFRDQVRALEILGGVLFDLQGQPLSAADISANRQWAASWLDGRPTVSEFLDRHDMVQHAERLIMHVTRPRGDGEVTSHTFVLDRGWYFDNNVPEGRPVALAEAPEELLNMRVIDVVAVRFPEKEAPNGS